MRELIVPGAGSTSVPLPTPNGAVIDRMPRGDAVALAVLVFLAKLAGGAIAVRRPRSVPLLSTLTGAVLLAADFKALLPAAVQRAAEVRLPALAPIAVAILGLALLIWVEGVVGRQHGSVYVAWRRAGSIAGASGFVGHGWLEGATIGIGLQVGTVPGLMAALAVAAHHLCEGLALVCYLSQQGRPPRRVILWLTMAALAPVTGALGGSVIDVPDRAAPLALGLFSGLFVFAGLSMLRHRGDQLGLAGPHDREDNVPERAAGQGQP
jgi:zinc transporter ZupT